MTATRTQFAEQKIALEAMPGVIDQLKLTSSFIGLVVDSGTYTKMPSFWPNTRATCHDLTQQMGMEVSKSGIADILANAVPKDLVACPETRQVFVQEIYPDGLPCKGDSF